MSQVIKHVARDYFEECSKANRASHQETKSGHYISPSRKFYLKATSHYHSPINPTNISISHGQPEIQKSIKMNQLLLSVALIVAFFAMAQSASVDLNEVASDMTDMLPSSPIEINTPFTMPSITLPTITLPDLSIRSRMNSMLSALGM